MIKILIADDHAIVREGLKQIVAEESGMIVAGEAGDANALLDMLRNGDFGIVVLDINMPGKSGLEALIDIKAKYPDLPVLILSMYSEEQYGLRALKAGADGYLKKVSAPDELVKAIRLIVNGGKFISQSLAEKMAYNLEKNKKSLPHESLSNREYYILCKIAAGFTADDMADELSISIHTVYSYRKRILEKMNLKSNVELTQYVIKNKLMDL